MIQFNLLPDVKMEYVRAQRLKQTIVSISVVVAGAAVAILVLLFLVVVLFQKQHLKAVDRDIKTDTSKLQSITDLNKILTVQNQLNSLPTLHGQKPVTSRLFSYLGQIIPAKISVTTLNLDFSQQNLLFTGTADNLATVNQFVDTLKFTTYPAGNANKNAFSGVVMTNFGRTEKGATFTINSVFDPAIFDSSQNISNLTVPKIITTRSEVDAPATLFNSQTPTSNQGAQ